MALKMARPIKLGGSNILQFKARIPIDLRDKVRGERITLPVGDELATVLARNTIQVSLRTNDPNEARRRHAKVSTTLLELWAAKRNGSQSLTHEQATALAGATYQPTKDFLASDFKLNEGIRDQIAAAVEQSGGDEKAWLSVIKTVVKNSEGRILPLFIDKSGFRRIGTVSRWYELLEQLFGEKCDRILSSNGIVIDADSRRMLLDCIRDASVAAKEVVVRNTAEGDYSPDNNPTRFPPLSVLAPLKSRKDKTALTLSGLIDLYKTTPRLTGRPLSPSTISRYASSFNSLVAYLEDPVAAEVTEESLRSYRFHLQTTGVTDANRKARLRTINSNDMVAIRSLFKWASEREEHDPSKGPPLPLNPSLEIKIRTLKAMGVTGEVEPNFRPEEIRTIFSAAMATPSRSLTAAYTGRRIAGICALKVEDFVEHAGVRCMKMIGQKGLVYTSYVPIHSHLIEQGLWEAVQALKAGPVFYNPKTTKRGPETAANHIRDWIRNEVGVKRAGVNPSHGWRSTFFTTADSPDDSGIPISDPHAKYIAGLTIAGVKETYYTRPETRAFAASLARFPRYDLEQPQSRGPSESVPVGTN
jgi:integrase